MALQIAGAVSFDHVYLKSDDGTAVWPCFGRSKGGAPVAVLHDADLEAAWRECPFDGKGSIKYGINGVAFQQANRILAAASTSDGSQVVVPSSVRGARASYFVWGLYGRSGGASMPRPPASTLKFQDKPDAETTAVLVASVNQWQALISHLSANPHLMRELDPRKFEELVAELLSRDGLQVELTPRQKDGGRDILAYMNTEYGRHLYLVECKRYNADHPVGVEIVRGLYGVVEYERATAGLLVTTSKFTAPAVEFQTTIKNRMTFKEYTHICEWLKKYAKRS